MSRKIKNAKVDFKRLVKKNKNFSRRSDIEGKFKKNKNNKIFILIFSLLTIIYLCAATYIIVNHSFSGWNYTLTSILIFINLIITLSIFINFKDNNKKILSDIKIAMKDNFTKEERNQFLRLKKLKNINSN